MIIDDLTAKQLEDLINSSVKSVVLVGADDMDCHDSIGKNISSQNRSNNSVSIDNKGISSIDNKGISSNICVKCNDSNKSIDKSLDVKTNVSVGTLDNLDDSDKESKIIEFKKDLEILNAEFNQKMIGHNNVLITSKYSLNPLLNSSSYFLNEFSMYNILKGSSYVYSGLGANSAFVPKLQTFYQRKKKKEMFNEDGNGSKVDMIDYQDIKETVRISKMNVGTNNNYSDPDMQESFKLWSLFSFNFNMTALMYNNFSS